MTKSQSQNRETNAKTETHDKEPITKQRDKRNNGNTWQAKTTRDRNVRISYTKTETHDETYRTHDKRQKNTRQEITNAEVYEHMHNNAITLRLGWIQVIWSLSTFSSDSMVLGLLSNFCTSSTGEATLFNVVAT